MSISIIIPALNEAERIAFAVERALALVPEEVLVVDGGSDDETAVLAERAGGSVIASARGRAVQQNRGAEAARGNVLLFLHADTWLEPGALNQIDGVLAQPNVVGGAFRQRIEAEGWLYRMLERGNAARVQLLKSAYGDQGIFVRRGVFEAVGRFAEVPLMEDVLLSRALRRRGRLALLPGPLHVSARRWQRHGIIRQTLRNWTLVTAHRLGVSTGRLARFYPSHGDPR